MTAKDFPTKAGVDALSYRLLNTGGLSLCEQQKDREEAAEMVKVLIREVLSSWAELDAAGM
jgi:hypothetical protein